MTLTEAEVQSILSDSAKRGIEQVRYLWPTLNFAERIDWLTHLRKFFNDSFVDTVEVLNGNAPLPWEPLEKFDAVHQ